MTGLRVAFRSLLRSPVLSLVVILSLGLGVGANTAIFSLLYQALIRSLPVKSPHELVVLRSPAEFKSGRTSTDNAGGLESAFSYLIFRELEKSPNGLSGLAAYRRLGANLSYRGRTLNGSVAVVSGGYFPVLGVETILGRAITWEDDRNAGNPVAVLSYGYWQDRLGGQTGVLNQSLRVNGQIFTIVGVLPRGFTGLTLGDDPSVYVPLTFKPAMTPGWKGTDSYNDYWLYLFGRLKPGFTLAQARDALNSNYAGLVQQQAKAVQPRDQATLRRFLASRVSLESGSNGQSGSRQEMEAPLYILFACTALVLLIAAANAANLLLARAAQRAKELAVRTAMGAGRLHIIRQLLTEAMLLAAAGGACGLLLAGWTLDAIITSLADEGETVYYLSRQLDWPILLFAMGVTVLTGLLFGLYPAWTASRGSLAGVMKEDSGNASSSRDNVRVRKALVCGQVAVSMLLLVPMGLFLKSLVNLIRVDLGIQTENLITFGISPELNGYDFNRCRDLFIRAEGELAAIPGVRGVTMSRVPLIGGSRWGNNLTVEGFRNDDPKADTHSMFNSVGPGYFSLLGIPLISGREISERDTMGSPKAAVVNQAFARHYFGEASPIGRRFGRGAGKDVKMDYEIVGVVKDFNYSEVREKPQKVYFAGYRQEEQIGSIQVYVRTALPTDQAARQIRRVMASLDADLPLEEMVTMKEQVSRNIREDRVVLQLASAFALLATALAVLGLYGVMAYTVARRTREIGIRIALGAGAERIRTLVLREVGVILISGVALGLPAALAVAKLAESQLFGVQSFDLTVVLGAVAALASAALLAGYLPAHRASKVNPIEALRYE